MIKPEIDQEIMHFLKHCLTLRHAQHPEGRLTAIPLIQELLFMQATMLPGKRIYKYFKARSRHHISYAALSYKIIEFYWLSEYLARLKLLTVLSVSTISEKSSSCPALHQGTCSSWHSRTAARCHSEASEISLQAHPCKFLATARLPDRPYHF